MCVPQSGRQELGASSVCPGSAGQGSWAEELGISAGHRKHPGKERLTKTLSDHVMQVLSDVRVLMELFREN